MKVLVFGQTGQVGQELQARKEAFEVQSLNRSVANFQDPAMCASCVEATDADAIIIAAAYTQVDAAENDEQTAHVINAETPGAIAQAASERGIPLIYISTDYVFDGLGDAAYATDHPVNPVGAYGRTKAAGETLVRQAGGPYAVLRTSWVFSPYGSNFVKTMLRLGAQTDSLSVVDNEVGGPTPASDIADACLNISRQLVDDQNKSGTYHFAGAPDVSWAGFARSIFQCAGISCHVNNIPASEYPRPAVRPLNSRLDTSTTLQTFGIARPNWETALRAMIDKKETRR